MALRKSLQGGRMFFLASLHCIAVLFVHTEDKMPHLHNRQYDKQLKSKVRQLEHHAATLSAPLLLPIVEEVGYESPADTDKAFLCDYFLAWQLESMHVSDFLQRFCLNLQIFMTCKYFPLQEWRKQLKLVDLLVLRHLS